LAFRSPPNAIGTVPTWLYSKIGDGLFFAPFDDFDGQILSIPIISILVGGFNHLEKY
jgi:hypothetical protein